jgi:hypothetical protein
MENLSDSRKKDVLPEFQAYLADNVLALGIKFASACSSGVKFAYAYFSWMI